MAAAKCCRWPKTRSEAPWPSFAASKAVFDRVVPYQTTSEDLRGLIIDPAITPSPQILTCPDIVSLFMPNSSFSLKDMDRGLRDCVADSSKCLAYQFRLERMEARRQGNFILDVLSFVRRTHQTGWRFNALVVIVDDVVVYKLCGGTPRVDEHLYRRNPLGPLQEPAEMVRDAGVISIL